MRTNARLLIGRAVSTPHGPGIVMAAYDGVLEVSLKVESDRRQWSRWMYVESEVEFL